MAAGEASSVTPLFSVPVVPLTSARLTGLQPFSGTEIEHEE